MTSLDYSSFSHSWKFDCISVSSYGNTWMLWIWSTVKRILIVPLYFVLSPSDFFTWYNYPTHPPPPPSPHVTGNNVDNIMYYCYYKDNPLLPHVWWHSGSLPCAWIRHLKNPFQEFQLSLTSSLQTNFAFWGYNLLLTLCNLWVSRVVTFLFCNRLPHCSVSLSADAWVAVCG